jgi:hypothetical protein
MLWATAPPVDHLEVYARHALPAHGRASFGRISSPSDAQQRNGIRRGSGMVHAACCTWIVALHVARCMRPVARCAFAQPLRRTDGNGPQVVGALLEQLADPRLQRRRDRNHDLPHSIPCARMLLRIGTMSYVAKRR